MPTRKRVVNRLRELVAIKSQRDGRSYNMQDVAEATGIPHKTVFLWWHNKIRRFDEGKLLLFAEFLGVDVSELIKTLTVENEEENLGNMEAAIPA